MAFAVEVALTQSWEHKDRIFTDLEGIEAEIAAIVEHARPDDWNRDAVDGFFADIEADRERQGGADTVYWTARMPRWILNFTLDAPTRELAAEAALGRLPSPLPEGWETATYAEPAP